MRSLFILLVILSCSQQQINQVLEEARKLDGRPLTQKEMSMGLKQALSKGVRESVMNLAQPNGYWASDDVRIPLPKEAQVVKDTLNKLGLSSIVKKAELSINRAAEDAATAAKPIFLKAITNLSFTDLVAIVRGNESEATEYLKRTTESELVNAFRPKVTASLKKVDATKYWGSVMSRYNRIPFIPKVNPDLNSHVNKLAIDGLFQRIAKEEVEIRKNPAARTTELLRRVFAR